MKRCLECGKRIEASWGGCCWDCWNERANTESSWTAQELVDGAYESVLTFKPENPAQREWQQKWLKDAKELGAGLDC